LRVLLAAALLGLAGTGTALAADDPALVALDTCRARLDARTDIGLERISKRCPELLRTLASAPWNDLLPQDLLERRDEISAESLRELGQLIRSSERGVTARELPDIAKLAPVLAGLGEKGQQGATRWERFKQWLKDKFDRREEDKDEDSWLEKFGRQFETSEGVAKAITYIGYALMGLLVLYVIWSELRAAGLLGGQKDSRRAQEAAQWRRRLQLTDVMQAPLADRPGLMLKLLGEALTRAHRLPAADGLTAATLVRQAKLDTDDDRRALDSLARTADAVRYGPQQPEEEKLQGAVSTARSLLDKFALVKASLFRRKT
jgi:hypothetical protein